MDENISTVYQIPFIGNLILEEEISYRIHDYILSFNSNDGYLHSLSINFETKIPGNLNIKTGLIYEPRKDEFENLVSNISSSISMSIFEDCYFDFEKRVINHETLQLSLGGGFNKKNETKSLDISQLDSSIAFSVLREEVDPSFTFFIRGFSDLKNRKYIEAFYNLFFFLEYLYGNGKTGKPSTVKEFLKNKIINDAIKHIKNDDLSLLYSSSFSDFIRESDPKEILEKIYDTRGNLHHPNSRRSKHWKPMKQLTYCDISTLIGSICLFISTKKFTEAKFEEDFISLKEQITNRRRRESKIPIKVKKSY